VSGTRLRVGVTLEQCWHRVPGGVARAALESARALLVDPAIEQVGISAWHRAPAPETWAPPIPVHALPLPRRALYESWHRLRWPPVSRAAGEVDVVHATALAIPPANRPLVVTVHDLAWERWPAFFTRHGVRFFRRSLELTREAAAIVVCPSEATAVDAVNAGLDPARVRIVPWGADQTPADPATVRRVMQRHGLSAPYVLWVGTIEPRKNLPVVIDAVNRLGRRDLDVVLVGPDGWMEAVPDPPAALAGRVRALGFVDEQDLRALYAGAAVFCYPSLLEGFGFPVLEAMVQGTPVVTSRDTATQEVLGEGGLAVPPADVDEVAGALEAVLDDRDRFAERARHHASRYTWDRTAERLASAYREAAR
jgi:glycosyltransferase involved in cell wall biosynthesis